MIVVITKEHIWRNRRNSHRKAQRTEINPLRRQQ